MTADIEIDGLDEGFLVSIRGAFSTKREYAPTLGQALSKVVYSMIRMEGDIPEPRNEGYMSETLQTIITFLKTFGPKAVEKALADNLADVPAPEEGSQDI